MKQGIRLLIPFLMAFLLVPASGRGSPEDSPLVEQEYLIGAEDVLKIQVWGREDLTGTVTVDFSGTIQLPLLGQVPVKGKTTADLANHLTERYRLLDPRIPDVIVTIEQYNNQSVLVVGEVKTPGSYGFRTIPDLWTILLKAGGPTRDADLAHIEVIRMEQTTGDDPRTVKVDLSEGVGGTDLTKLPRIRSKDSVVIPTRTEFQSPGNKFQIIGAVLKPGIYSTSGVKTVVDAIALSGGAAAGADLRRVRLTKTTPLGGLSYELNVRDYLDGSRSLASVDVEPGDVVNVPQGASKGKSFIDGLTRFSPILSIATSAISIAYAVRR